jgi:hypothetical protein
MSGAMDSGAFSAGSFQPTALCFANTGEGLRDKKLSAEARRHLRNLQHGEDYLYYKFWESLQEQLERVALTDNYGRAALEYLKFPSGFDDFADKMLRLEHTMPSVHKIVCEAITSFTAKYGLPEQWWMCPTPDGLEEADWEQQLPSVEDSAEWVLQVGGPVQWRVVSCVCLGV